MAFDLGEKLRALWKLQPWYLWAGEGLAVGTIAYIAITNRAAASVSATDVAPTADRTTPPGEAPGPGTSPGDSPPGYQPPVQPPDTGPAPEPPPLLQPPGYQPPGRPPIPTGIAPSKGPPQRQPSGSGGKSSLLAHAFADVHVPSEWHENHHQLGGGSRLLPFHTAGEY